MQGKCAENLILHKLKTSSNGKMSLERITRNGHIICVIYTRSPDLL